MFLLFLSFFVLASAADYKNCELKDGRFACMKTFNDIRDNVLTGPDSNEAVEKLSKLCSEYRKCAEGMKCKAEAVIIGYIDKLLMLCDVIDFRNSAGFKACGSKMEANRSTCFREWNPFPDTVEDKKKMEEIQKESCKNFFGKDNCMEKEITDLCGLEMWKLHKKTYNDIRETVLTGVDNIEAIETLSKLCLDYGKCAEGMKCKAENVIIEHIQTFVILCGVFDVMKSEASRIVNDIGDNELNGGHSDEAIEKTSKLCSEYRKCAAGMKFKASDEMIGHIDRLLVLCDVNDFSKSNAFKACGAKMEANKSTCYQEWIPFPDKVEDEKKMEEIQKEACRNFFGKDNCIEKEITDMCGLEMWKLYKEKYYDIRQNFMSLDFIKDAGVGTLFNMCKEFRTCAPSIECGEKNDEIMVDKMYKFCDVMEYRKTHSFEECGRKLNNRNSQCYKEWQSPLPESDDPKKTEEILQEFYVIIEHIDELLTLCDVIDFRQSTDFKACGAKIEANRSTCIPDWNPFPDRVEDQKKMEEIQKEACKNFFGKDNCIEKEITDICGLGMWKLYKEKYYDIRKNSLSLDFIQDASIETIFNICEEFRTCAPSIECGEENKDIKVDKMMKFCDVMEYRKNHPFEECGRKVNDRMSQCYRDWGSPLPESDDPKKTEEILKGFCNNYFGKDNCMEKEVTELCGVEGWTIFKKMFLDFNKVSGRCKFD
ncbi:hypothetical protein B9Z55_016833 [Caenorhabditis nigoni]|uniref:T20D4.11-like domain-containing protein n=1 Tax=Caenorhabditis nigoni TaxID=1611254 RepID=A0A2G5T6G2_9PELO|nr:hypothetical protein B9Z55_016833 [Caenorhabditis nigoni]